MRAPDGAVTELRRQSAAVLRLLAAHRGEIVGKQAIYDAVWGDIAVTEDSLVQCIGDIRQALGSAREMVRTAPRQGYRLELETPSARKPRKAAHLAGALTALILVAGWIGYGARDPSPPPVDAFAGPTVAVLPFGNLAGGERWDRLARGLTEEVIADLATNPWLSVLADATTRPHAGKTPQTVGAALGSRHVVTGAVQVEGDRLRVTTALADAASGRQLWTQRWDGATGDLLAIQTAAAESLAGELAGRYSGAIARADRARAHRQKTGSLEAYELYLLGVEHKHRFTLADYDIAEDYLHRATAIDPGFAKAWVVLAVIQTFRAGYVTSDAEYDVFNDRHRDYAMRALAADPDDPGALIEASRVYADSGDLAAAERALRRAVELAPNDADVLAIAGWCGPERASLGRDALTWVERALALNPDGPGYYMVAKGAAAFAAGEYAIAAAALRAAPPEGIPDRWLYLAAAEALNGDMASARAAATALREQVPGFDLAFYLDGWPWEPGLRARVLDGAVRAGLGDAKAARFSPHSACVVTPHVVQARSGSPEIHCDAI